MRRFLRSRALVALVVVVGLLMAVPGTARAEEATPPPMRILLYGDSQTMGSSGDWTWRYHLWHDLAASGGSFDFVGPRDDVLNYTTGKPGSQAYRDPAFDRDHASMGGMTFMAPKLEVSLLAYWYRPQVVVGMIGGNDLLKSTATPAELVDKWRAQIALIRTFSPRTAFVLVQQPATWVRGSKEYNAGMVALARELDTISSRVVTTPLLSFSPWVDTFDLLHPSASGERKIAWQVSMALAWIWIGSGPRPAAGSIAERVETGWAPPPTTDLSDDLLRVSWPAVEYASAEDVYVEDLTAGSPAVVTRVKGTSWSTTVLPGHEYRIWLRPVKGYLPIGTSSEVLTVVVPPLPPDPPPEPEPDPEPEPEPEPEPDPEPEPET